MMIVRSGLRTALTTAAMASMILLPGVLWARRPGSKAVKHKVVKHHMTHRVPRRKPAHVVPKRKLQQPIVTRKLTHPVPAGRKKAVPASRKYKAPRARHIVYRRRIYRYRRHVRLPLEPSADRIDQIQEALARNGFYQGDPTGRWDATTIEAMKSFQQAHGISPTGKIDASSLQQLGLGSSVAGVAAPRPVVPAPSASTTTADAKSSNYP